MAASKDIAQLLTQASGLATAEVERLARSAMRSHPRCKSFCMAMGSLSFYDSKGEPVEDEHAAYRALDGFLYGPDDINEALRVTGTPMRITGADGIKQTDW